jgi:hypothetical protein
MPGNIESADNMVRIVMLLIFGIRAQAAPGAARLPCAAGDRRREITSSTRALTMLHVACSPPSDHMPIRADERRQITER